MDQGGVYSSRTETLYSNMLEALTSGERWHDCEVSWDFDSTRATAHKDIDSLYDQRLSQLRKQYDVLELSWGGGYDSSYLLEISHRNNIPYDIITMIGHKHIDDKAVTNLELKNNYAHINRYIKKFPRVEIRFIDMAELWEITKQDTDRSTWTKCSPTLDDICGQSCDDLLGRIAQENRCVIVGKGWKKTIYNPNNGIWSMFHTTDDLYRRLAHTDACDYVHFYGTPDIVLSACELVRSIGAPDAEAMWIPQARWIQENVLYKKFALPIWHGGKTTTNNEFTEPKMNWFIDSNKPVQPEIHKEYWDYISECNTKIHPDDLGGNPMPIGYYQSKSKIVDFYKK